MSSVPLRKPYAVKDFRLALRLLVLVPALLLLAHPAAAMQSIRVAVLKFGTVSWELSTVRHHGLDRAEGVDLQVVELAGKQATMVALQSGEVDVAVSDWLWVSRQRAQGNPFAFVPYSTASGSLVVPAESSVENLEDLRGRRLGIAGGPLDKNWLLFRALSLQERDADLAQGVETVFGAPPLLNQQILQGRIDGVINFWPYVARLEAAGMRPLLSAHDAAQRLGIGSEVPLIGYIFDERWAARHPEAIGGFIEAVERARALLAESDEEWERLRPLMQAPDQDTFLALQDGFRAGIPRHWGEAEKADAARLYRVLARLGGKALVGEAQRLSEGTFWSGASD
jgi:NitT/TauT family transport system substrate-binding protein